MSQKKALSDQYIVSEEEDGEEEEDIIPSENEVKDVRKAKKQKTSQVKKEAQVSSVKEKKTDKTKAKLKLEVEKEVASFIQIGEKKRVSVSKYKGSTLIDIREYYEKDGAQLPGKKGISLSIDQWNEMTGNIQSIERMIREA